MVRGFSHLFVRNSFELFADTAQKKLRDPYQGAGPVMKCVRLWVGYRRSKRLQMRCLTCCKCGRCSQDTSKNITSQCCRVQAAATLLSICYCVTANGVWGIFSRSFFGFLCVCVCLTVQIKNFPWLWFSLTELLKWFLKVKPAARTDRGDSVWVTQNVHSNRKEGEESWSPWWANRAGLDHGTQPSPVRGWWELYHL